MKNCINTGDITCSNKAYGIGQVATAQYCINYGTVTGSESYPIGSVSASWDRPEVVNLYLTGSGVTAAANSMAMTEEQFASGEAAYMLREVYGQTIGTDARPVFNNGENTVIKLGETYVNLSAENVDALIETIGEVSLDSEDTDCFAAVLEVKNAYDLLGEDEKENVTGKSDLDEKLQAYDGVIASLNASFNALGSIEGYEDLKTAVSAAKENYNKFLKLGGTTDKLTMLSELSGAVTRLNDMGIAAAQSSLKKDENGIYQITNADELYVFASIAKNDLTASAVLTQDIVINEDLLEEIEVDSDGFINPEKAKLVDPGL